MLTTPKPRAVLPGFLLIVTLLSSSTMAQDPTPEEMAAARKEFLARFKLIEGPGTQRIGGMATIDFPESYLATGSTGTRDLMQEWGNIPGRELALIASNNVSWVVTFDFEDIGYVEDDEKDDLDADDLLENLQEIQEAGNEARKKQGLETLELIGFARKPYYDEEFNSLAWAIKLRAESGNISINHNIKLLGRKGVMNATWVGSPEDYKTAMTEVTPILKQFKFTAGQKYSDFRDGDKIAEYGLTGLVAGGALFALAKTGLLKKLLKPLIFVGVAIAAFFKKIFGRGGKNKKSGRNVYNETDAS